MANPVEVDEATRIRALAQQHLIEIESDKALEEEQERKAQADIRRYAKISAVERRRLNKNTEGYARGTEESKKKYGGLAQDQQSSSRFRPFDEVLHQLRWDDKLHTEDYRIGYLERFTGMQETLATTWLRDVTEEEWIPMHRVRYVRRVEKSGRRAEEDSQDIDEGPDIGIVWDRDLRIDKLSG